MSLIPLPRPLQDAAFLCLKDLLHAIDCAEETGNEADAASAQSVLRELLYHEETDDAGLLAVGTRQLRSFSHAHQSPAVAGAAVELIHIVIKHLEDLAERSVAPSGTGRGGRGREGVCRGKSVGRESVGVF